jgi:hypothetical protein
MFTFFLFNSPQFLSVNLAKPVSLAIPGFNAIPLQNREPA